MTITAGPRDARPGDVIDSTETPVVGQRRELKPILASWLRDRGEFVEKVTDVSHRAGHTTLWHLAHSPLHALRVLRYAPRGFWRVLKLVWDWVMYMEAAELRRNAVHGNDQTEWGKRVKERREHIHRRWIGLAAMTAVSSLALLLLWWLLPDFEVTPWLVLTREWLFSAAAIGAIGALGYVGRPLDKGASLIPAATSVHGDVKLTNGVVLDALCALGIAKMNDPAEIELLYGVKPAKAGYNIDLTLPRGVEATEVMAKRGKLSSGLQRGVDTVWPSVGPRHAGHLVLFISHEGMSTAKQKQWPLLKHGTVDLFNPVPMFTDQRGDWVDLRVATTSGVVGAIPRMGKTYFLRQLGLVAGLDPRAEVYTFELKGTGDMSSHKLFAHYYSDSDEEEDIAEHLTVLRKLKQERRKRAKIIKSLPDEQCPRSEVTTELASRKDLGLHLIVVIADEVQTWTEHAIKAIQEEFIAIIEELVRKGPAVGIQVFLATQKVDAKSIPTSISSNASTRLCFKVNDATSNNQILGPGSYANGLQATMFDFEKDKGVAYLKAAGPAQIVRSVSSLDKVESEKVALRARAARIEADRLTGAAAGEEMDAEEAEVVLLDDCRRVMGNADTMHLTTMAEGLAELRASLYGNLDSRSLGSQLRTAGVQTGSVYVPGKGRGKGSATGVKREWLDVASTEQVGNTDPESVGDDQ